MKKVVIGVILSTFVVGTFAFAVEAQRRGRGRRGGRQPAAAKVREAPRSAAIAPSLGDLHWGMTREEVATYFSNQIRERYRPLIAKAPGGIEEDRLRAQMTDELRRVREGQVQFNGQRTGWDISFLREEFTHNNGEAMLQINDGNSQNFYFFINNHLWKWFKAFNADVFSGQDFSRFAAGVQQRFGQAVERRAELVAGAGERQWLEWQDDTTRLRAVDQTRFYGFYCLVFESKDTLGQLATLRRNVAKRGTGTNALVEAVTSGQGESATDTSANSDIVDRITGKIRNRQDAPATGTGSTTKRTGTGTPPTTGTTTTTRAPEDDPLRGMDL